MEAESFRAGVAILVSTNCSKLVHPEPVEGLSFLRDGVEEAEPFDRLRANGVLLGFSDRDGDRPALTVDRSWSMIRSEGIGSCPDNLLFSVFSGSSDVRIRPEML